MHDPIAAHFRRLVGDGHNVFLTGMAGTGKSTLLRGLIDDLGDEVTVTASTGIAALNIGGSTVHRWSGMMLGPKRGENLLGHLHELMRDQRRSVRAGFDRIRNCRIPAGAAQEERIESLLAESDSLRLFVKARIERCKEGSLTTEEILSAYENYCALQEWEALPRKRFDQQLGPLMMEFHRAPKRNDLKRGGSTKRGFMNVRVIESTPDPDTAP